MLFLSLFIIALWQAIGAADDYYFHFFLSRYSGLK